MPKLDGILETAIHTEDMARARAFYEGVLGLEPIYSDSRFLLMRWPGAMSFWSFARAPRGRPLPCPAGPFPATAAMARCMWRSPSPRKNSIAGRRILLRAGSPSKGENDWDRGGRSIYFRDPTATFLNCDAGIMVGLLDGTPTKWILAMRKLHCLISAAATSFAVPASAQPFSTVTGSWGYGGYGSFHAVLWVIILIALILEIIWRVWATKT